MRRLLFFLYKDSMTCSCYSSRVVSVKAETIIWMLSCFSNLRISFRSLVCMEGHCLALRIEHLGESVLLLLLLFQQSSLCPYQVMEAVVFLHFLLTMMDFLHIDLQPRQHLKTSSYTGETYNCCTIKIIIVIWHSS